jgi:hypothetical protein
MYTIGFPTSHPYVIGDVVTPTLMWDTRNLTWNDYDDLSSVVTVLDYHPHPDMLVVYEYLSDGSRIRLRI